MRILLLTNKMPYPPHDGGAFATLSLALALNRAGAKLTVLAVNTKKHFVNIAELPAEISTQIEFIDVFANTDIHLFDALSNFIFSKKPYNAQRFIFNIYKEKLKEILLENKFDIIQVEGLYMLPYAEICKKYSAALISYRAHNIESEIWANYALEPNFLKRFYLKNLYFRMKNFEKALINSYDLLIPIAQTDVDFFIKQGNNKPIQVITAGVEPKKTIQIEISILPASIAYIGALDWHANQEGLVWFIEQVLPLVQVEFSDSSFHLAGRNASESFVNYVKEKNILFYGEVESADSFLRNKEIIVVPLQTGSGIRIKIIEAMQHGKPIVCTSKALQGIDAKHNEHLLVANSPKEFAQHLISLLKSEKLRTNLSLNAKQFVSKNFDTFALASRLLNFYLEQVKKQKAKVLEE